MPDGYGDDLRFVSGIKAFKGTVDPAGQGLGVQLIQVALRGSGEKLRSAHAEFRGGPGHPIERLVRDGDGCLHGPSITWYNRRVARFRATRATTQVSA